MTILRILFRSISLLLLMYTLYFTVLAAAGFPKKRKSYPDTGKKVRLAILIPARNEETVIGHLLDSILLQDYPAELFKTCVLLNHCTDRTEEIAERYPVMRLTCTAETQTKGEVLAWAFRELRTDPQIDAFVVLDADNRIPPSFLTEISRTLAAGASVVQCRRTGNNTDTGWIPGCYEIYYAMQNAFYNHPRSVYGLSAAVNGTGWAVTKEWIEKKGFVSETITEDFELTVQCALENEKIAYCPAAVTYDTFTDDLSASMIQRIRWTYGILQCVKKYEGRLLRKAVRGSLVCLDTALVNIMAIVIAATFVTTVTDYLFLHTAIPFPVYIACSAAVSWLLASLSALAAVWKSGSGVRRSLRGILTFPLFILTWFPILIACFFMKDCRWTSVRDRGSGK